MSTIGERIERLREEKMKSRVEVALACGFSEMTLYRYEKIPGYRITEERLRKIAEYLGVPMGAFYSESGTIDFVAGGSIISIPSVNREGISIGLQTYRIEEGISISVPFDWASPSSPATPFVFKVDASSLPSVIPDQSEVIVNPNLDAMTGDVILAAVDGVPAFRIARRQGDILFLGDRQSDDYCFPLGKVTRVVTKPVVRV